MRGEPNWLLDWRIAALRAWQKMHEPHWAEIDYAPINYDELNYYNEPKPIDNSDLRATYEKMGLPQNEQNALLGMATDTVIDSRSVHTSYTDTFALEIIEAASLIFSKSTRLTHELTNRMKLSGLYAPSSSQSS